MELYNLNRDSQSPLQIKLYFCHYTKTTMKKYFIWIPAAILFLAGCNNNATSGDPKAVLSAFMTALSKKDVETAKKYVTADSEGMLSMMQMSIKNMEAPDATNQFNPDKITIGEAKIDGNEAQVPVTEKTSGETVNFILKKESGDWKVAFDLNTLARMAQEKMKEKGMNDVDLDSIMKSIPQEQLEKGKELVDSMSKVLKDIPPAEMEKAKKMLDSLSKEYH